FGLIVVDEAQDMSAPQLEIAQMSLAPGGRMVVVGDDRQAIYRFRGADSNALDRLKTELHASELGLTTTFRCGARIVQEAQRLVPDIQALPTIHAGAYDVVSAGRLYATVRPGDFVLSRLNAPLTRCAMTLLRRGTRAKIQGRDIGRTLSALADRISQWGKITNMALWRNELDAWCAREVRKAEEADVLARAALVTDQAATLLVLAENATDVAGIKDRISYLFDDVAGDNSFVICSTVHRAKGLEADSVYVLADTFVVDVQCLCGHRHRRGMPECLKCKCGAYVPDPGAVLEEQNIRYVAITRAKRNLWWVISEVR
ncbi:MAG: UvrD-helicase domain-containing protein, partial [Vicinamibacterales bacterium]